MLRAAQRVPGVGVAQLDHGAEVAGVLDGGPCAVGIESTIVDCSRGQPVLLRPGRLTMAQLEEAAGEPLLWSRPEAPDPDAPPPPPVPWWRQPRRR